MYASFFLIFSSIEGFFCASKFQLFQLTQYSGKSHKAVIKKNVFLQDATHWEAFGLPTPTMAVKAPLCVTDVDLSHRWA